MLADSGATRDAFLRLARGADLIHFAGHARTVRGNTPLSHLVLAPSPDDPEGVLTGADIARQSLRHVGLVVLSSCGSTSPGWTRRGAIGSVAEAFRLAGVGGIISSLWEVDDESTAALMDDLYRELGRTGDPAAALRSAQLRAIRSGWTTLRTWSAFRYQRGLENRP